VGELISAAYANDVEVELDARSLCGYTALQLALMWSDYATAQLLLKNGASVLNGGDNPTQVPTALMIPFNFQRMPSSGRCISPDVITDHILLKLLESLSSSLGLEQRGKMDKREGNEDGNQPLAKRRRSSHSEL
jgi:hypothetical protein